MLGHSSTNERTPIHERSASRNNFPKLHNAAWPGVVGKGDGGEPPIDLDTMLDLTAAAEVDGVKFDGFDLFLFAPHIDIDCDGRRASSSWPTRPSRATWTIGSVVAPVWPPTGGGSAMGDDEEREKFLGQVRKGCRIAKTLRELGVRPYGVVRIDSAMRRRRPGPTDPEGNTQTDRRDVPRGLRRSPRTTASGWPPKAKSAGAACTVGSGWSSCWRWSTARRRSASRPTWPTRCCTCWATTPRKTPSCREDFDLERRRQRSTRPTRQLTDALRPWTIDFHVAQNDATVHGSGSHDKTGRHCLANDPNGKLDIARARRLLAARRRRRADQDDPPHLLGRLHVPQRRDDEAARRGTTSWRR